MKLNVGSAQKRIEGFTNLDVLDWSGNTDILHDLNSFPYPFEEGAVEEIHCRDALEHIAYFNTERVLREFYRILQPGGLLAVRVPDCGKAMQYFVEGRVCDCVPQKTPEMGAYVAKPNCPRCGGKAVMNTTRWLLSFTGAQKHEYDIHRMIFTTEMMREILERVGFREIAFKDNPYKIRVSARK